MAEDLLQPSEERAQGEIAASQLRTTHAVRERCARLLAHARTRGSAWFDVDEDAMRSSAREVATTIRHDFPRLNVPVHSVWRLLGQDGIDRREQLEQPLQQLTPAERTHARLDFAVVAVLLSTAMGSASPYTEPATGRRLAGEAGRVVGTLHAFNAGLFSSDPQRPFQCDAHGLRGVVTDQLAGVLQVHPPEAQEALGRQAVLLRRLGELLSEQPEVFGEDGRPAGVFDVIVSPYGHGIPHTADVDAHDILSQLLTTLPGLWPGAGQLGGVALGDCWRHGDAGGDGPSREWVPLHATLQALALSLLEPFFWGGVQVRGIGGLTAIADRPLCDWMLETGVLRLRDERTASSDWTCGDAVVVEWRALSLALMEEMAPLMRDFLGCERSELPMGCILEGVARAADRNRSGRHPARRSLLRVDSEPALF